MLKVGGCYENQLCNAFEWDAGKTRNEDWEMGIGEWGLENGEWGMGNGNGEGEWEIKNGKLKKNI